jgi:branched-chain amino acid transport system ATP-binding protein
LSAVRAHIALNHVDLVKVAAEKRAHLGVGYLPEDRRLVPEFSAEDNSRLPAWSVRLPDWQDRLAWVYQLVREIEEFRDQPATALSGGQQKLVALARALLVGQRLLLLDEPSERVAPVLAQRIWSILRNLRTEDVSTLIAESNVHHIANFVDGIFTVERGGVTAGLGVRDRRSKNAMQPGRQHSGGMQ